MERVSPVFEYDLAQSTRRMKDVDALSDVSPGRDREGGDDGRLSDVGLDGREEGVLPVLGVVLPTVDTA